MSAIVNSIAAVADVDRRIADVDERAQAHARRAAENGRRYAEARQAYHAKAAEALRTGKALRAREPVPDVPNAVISEFARALARERESLTSERISVLASAEVGQEVEDIAEQMVAVVSARAPEILAHLDEVALQPIEEARAALRAVRNARETRQGRHSSREPLPKLTADTLRTALRRDEDLLAGVRDEEPRRLGQRIISMPVAESAPEPSYEPPPRRRPGEF